jgi:hypothetical protein
MQLCREAGPVTNPAAVFFLIHESTHRFVPPRLKAPSPNQASPGLAVRGKHLFFIGENGNVLGFWDTVLDHHVTGRSMCLINVNRGVGTFTYVLARHSCSLHVEVSLLTCEDQWRGRQQLSRDAECH